MIKVSPLLESLNRSIELIPARFGWPLTNVSEEDFYHAYHHEKQRDWRGYIFTQIRLVEFISAIDIAHSNIIKLVDLKECLSVKSKSFDRVILTGANLKFFDLSGLQLSWAKLQGANLEFADLRGANLYGANLTGANLHLADLKGANLNRTKLFRANLTSARIDYES